MRRPAAAGLLRPPRLRPGDVVALVAPGGLVDEAQVARAVAHVESLGLRVRQAPNLCSAHGNTAGTVAERIDAWHTMWRDPSVRALWAVRGGSGSAALLPLLDLDLVRREPKAVVGYSDLTALLVGLHQRTGLVTFHAPVGISTFSDYSVAGLRAVLMDARSEVAYAHAADNLQRAASTPAYQPRVLRAGTAEGRLVGGNLTLLAALVGTPWAADWRDAILFVEEIGEQPYRIDRLLTQLQQSQGLQHAAALMAGVFVRCEAPPGEPSLSLAETLRLHLGAAGPPAVAGWSFGHVAHQMTLPLGVRARLDGGAGTLTLLEPAVV